MAISGLADEVTGALIATAIDTAAPLTAGDRRKAGRRRLDGLAEIARRYLADPAAPRRGGGGHPHLIVTVDRPPCTPPDNGTKRQRPRPGEHAGAGPGGTLSWIGRIAGSTTGRVGCDATATFVTIGPDGAGHPRPAPAEVLHRRPTPGHHRPRRRPLRMALVRPAGRLVRRPPPGPGRAGGPTTVANGALPCEAHHIQLHEGRWQPATTTRRPLPRPPHRHRPHHRPRPHPPGHNRPPPPPQPDPPP